MDIVQGDPQLSRPELRRFVLGASVLHELDYDPTDEGVRLTASLRSTCPGTSWPWPSATPLPAASWAASAWPAGC